jgi:hypothetical protein
MGMDYSESQKINEELRRASVGRPLGGGPIPGDIRFVPIGQNGATGPGVPTSPVMTHYGEIVESTARLHNLIESLSERLAPFCSSRDDQAKMAAVPVDPPTIRPDSQFEFALVEVNQRVQIAANRIAHLLDTMRI